MENELQPFDYSTVNVADKEKLQQREAVIRKNIKTMSDSAYVIGEQLTEAHEELANYRNGTFFEWCESIGIKRTSAQDFMSYYDFICRNAANKTMLESLPKRLIVDANRPSTPQALKDGVAQGDITTLAEFRDMKARLSAMQDTAARLEAARGAAVTAA